MAGARKILQLLNSRIQPAQNNPVAVGSGSPHIFQK
jgi:hypothetical protein